MNKTRKLVVLALLTAVSLCLFVVEMQVPNLIPVPGVKLGLANIITLFILYDNRFKWSDAVLVVIARVGLAALVTGNVYALLYSFVGGIFALAVMLLMKKVFEGKLIPVVSVAGGITHNIGQVVVAVIIYGAGVLFYLPVLVLGGIASGLLTGFTAVFLLKRLKNIGRNKP
ncbi:MAG: Gx transporter family protein [Oscillospiraceae bacterium]|nr:Gx transporter family protein [Oscillospiraceae bacterium]